MPVVPVDRGWPGVRAPGPFSGAVGRMERVLADYPAERVVRVMVDDIPAGLRAHIVDRLGDLAGASSRSSSGNERSATVILAPVRDVEAFAKKIDFGKVVKVDPAQRVIEVVIDDPKKLPTPLPPAVKTPADPKFYAQNLADLTCWDKRRREEALERLGKAEPKELKAEIAAAMTTLAADREAGARKAAVGALARWSGVEAVPTLSAALRDDDVWVRKAAMEGLGEIKHARAAEAVAGVIAAQRHEGAAALRRIGPVAEDVVIGLLKHEDGWVRMDAAKVLEEIGSAKSLPALGVAAKERDGLVQMAAERAVKAIEERAK
jgi:HEAT repeat protein